MWRTAPAEAGGRKELIHIWLKIALTPPHAGEKAVWWEVLTLCPHTSTQRGEGWGQVWARPPGGETLPSLPLAPFDAFPKYQKCN